MKNFYQIQTLSTEKLARSSYRIQTDDVTVFTELPGMIEYYLTRWKHLNRISTFEKEFQDPSKPAGEFLNSPQTLLDSMHHKCHGLLEELEDSF